MKHTRRRSNVIAALVAIVMLLGERAYAEIRLGPLFTDGMVLQRDRANPIWGHAAANARVVLTIDGRTVTAAADATGRFRAKLPAMPAGGPHTLVVTTTSADGASEERIQRNDVLVGEVWVCSGQSNMEWPVAASKDGAIEVIVANQPRIRLFKVPRRAAEAAQSDIAAQWVRCTPETVAGFSAVGYFYGRLLHDALEVPVGLIDATWGGTPAEAWTSREALEQEPALAPLLDRWDRATSGDEEQARQRRLHPHRPANLYHGMIAPLVPFGIRGAIWYQGETNAPRAEEYRTIFPTMIANWRAVWKQGDFPFYFVQLANFMQPAETPTDTDWARLRDAQRFTDQTVPNTGMAVITDIGMASDIHPRNKQDVARRLARLALVNTYGYEGKMESRGPVFTHAEREDDAIRLHFDHLGVGNRRGLMAWDNEPLRGFAIAGPDGEWHWAEARIDGETIVVRHPSIAEPAAVRYNWADNPDGNLYNRADLPAGPFEWRAGE